MNTVTLVYSVVITNQLGTNVQAAMMAVEYPPEIMQEYLGCRLVSDTPGFGSNTATRTTVFSFIPTSDAALTCVPVDVGGSGTALKSITVDSPGAGYVAVPFIAIDPPPAFDSPNQVGNADLQAYALATMGLADVTVSAGGTGYTGATVTFVGGLGRNGVAATGVVHLNPDSHAVSSITISTPGSGYVLPPEVVITSSSGSGATASASLGVASVILTNPGGGYSNAIDNPAVGLPDADVVPRFKALFPDSSDQRAPFYNFLTAAISQATRSPCTAADPVLGA